MTTTDPFQPQEKRLIDMTGEEFVRLIREAIHNKEPEDEPSQTPSKKNYVYGIGGIAQLFNCSMTTANRIKQSGKIDEAITQTGRIIVVDSDLALELIKK